MTIFEPKLVPLKTLLLENSSFSPMIPGLQIAWDSTSLGTLKDCARKYYYSIVLGWQPREMSVHLFFGIIYHSSLELFDRLRAEGMGFDEATRWAVRYALRETWNKELRRPWFSDHKTKNRFTLIRTIIWYIETFKENPIEPIQLAGGRTAVELSFRFQTDVRSVTGNKYILCGHLDKIGIVSDIPWIVDRKTTQYAIDENYFAKYTPDNQMSTYDFAGGIIYQLPIKGIIVDAAQILVTFSRFARQHIPRTVSQRDEWYENTVVWLKQAEEYAVNQRWPMNDKACHHYGGCPFRPICSKPPETRDFWLERNYVRRIWDPLQIRGDI